MPSLSLSCTKFFCSVCFQSFTNLFQNLFQARICSKSVFHLFQTCFPPINSRSYVFTSNFYQNLIHLQFFNFFQVPEVRDYMFSRSFVPEEQLHKMSREIEPPISSKFAAAATSQQSTGLDRLQSNLFRNANPGRVIGRRTLGIMKPQMNSVAV